MSVMTTVQTLVFSEFAHKDTKKILFCTLKTIKYSKIGFFLYKNAYRHAMNSP